MKSPHCFREVSDLLLIKELNIEVQREAKVMKTKEIIIPEGMRLLTLQEATYISDNDLLEDYPHKEWELLQQFSKKNLEKGYKYSALYRGWYDGVRLNIYGAIVGSDSFGYAFGVRFCRDVKK